MICRNQSTIVVGVNISPLNGRRRLKETDFIDSSGLFYILRDTIGGKSESQGRRLMPESIADKSYEVSMVSIIPSDKDLEKFESNSDEKEEEARLLAFALQSIGSVEVVKDAENTTRFDREEITAKELLELGIQLEEKKEREIYEYEEKIDNEKEREIHEYEKRIQNEMEGETHAYKKRILDCTFLAVCLLLALLSKTGYLRKRG